ncbi:hypothetical protein OAS18_07230 [Nitrospinaceae bacterium]|nr:hypothetical protein [Nitrospinaceae bacterium]
MQKVLASAHSCPAPCGIFAIVSHVCGDLGISLIIPILALMTNADLAVDYPMIEPWMNRFGNPSHEKLVVFSMLALVGVALLKVLFLAFLAWRQASFSFGIVKSPKLGPRTFRVFLL